MTSARIDICYRPLRIGWAIRADDFEAFRRAARSSFALWGGGFNPILVVDRPDEAKQLADLFRVDLVVPVGESEEVKTFPTQFPHLIKPFLGGEIFVGENESRKYCQVLDVQNMFIHVRGTSEWAALRERGIRRYYWQPDDPLADVFLLQVGAYPTPDEHHIDYRDLLMQASGAAKHAIEPSVPVPLDILDHASVSQVSRCGLKRHYSVAVGWNMPGFFLGDATSLDDLVCSWNLRAAGVPIWFVDANHLDRYTQIVPNWKQRTLDRLSGQPELRSIAVWSRDGNVAEARRVIGEDRLSMCPASELAWNGLNIRPPMMYLGEVPTLAVTERSDDSVTISFSLNSKPVCSDAWFHTQHLVASVKVLGGLPEDADSTFTPPFVPEFNEFYSRAMHFDYSKLRVEPDRVGIVITATEKDTILRALPVIGLVERVFEYSGFDSALSDGGRITRQLISQVGGVQGARVFKIPGVRRLLKTYGPRDAFTKRCALQLIGCRDPEVPDATFADHLDLFIEPRARGTSLTVPQVFSYLVERGLFSVGGELTCPRCRLTSWIALRQLAQIVVCELCQHEYNATRQLVKEEWHYRRSGVLGAEKNALGAVPVALALQQLDSTLRGVSGEGMYVPSVRLKAKDRPDDPGCEIDLVWVIPRPSTGRTALILGECKDRGMIDRDEFEKDIKNLGRVADALWRRRFDPFILYAKLSPFTAEEIDLARTLNSGHDPRVILLTPRELEPYRIYERAPVGSLRHEYTSTPEDLAEATVSLFFRNSPTAGNNPAGSDAEEQGASGRQPS